MKKYVTYLIILLVLLASCFSSIDKRMPLLQCADSLIRVSCSDSALYLLEAISFQDLKTPSSRAEYALLLTQAKDKCYIPHTNDSLIRMAVDFYEVSGNILSRAKSHYYLGRVYQDMENIPGTAYEFLTAMPLAEVAEDYELICLLQANLGHLFYTHGLLDAADSLYQRVEQLAELHNDSSRLAVALCIRGDICIEKGTDYYAKADEYQKRALILSEAVGNVYIESKVVNSLSSLYQRMKRSSESLLFAKRGISLQPDSTKHSEYHLIMGSVYYEMNQDDSAAIYFVKSLSNSDFYTKEEAYLNLSRIAIRQRRMKEAMSYGHYYVIYKDSATLLERPVELVSSLKDILYQRSAQEYESFLYRYRYALFVLGGVLSLVVAYFIYKRRQGKRKVYSLLENQQILHRKIELSENTLEEKESEIKHWQQQCDMFNGDLDYQTQINLCLNELLGQKRLICSDLESQLEQQKTVIEKLGKVNFKDLLKASPCYQTLLALQKDNKANPDNMRKMTYAEWQSLVAEINYVTFDFTKRLSDKFEWLLEDDIHLCCLIKLGFKYTDIALLLACSIDAVYKRSHAALGRMKHDGSINQLKNILEQM